MSSLIIGSANTEDVIILDDYPLENGKQPYSKVLRFEDRHSLGRFKGVGGSAVNWSFWLKAAGGRPLLVCPIGNDIRGNQLRDELSQSGLEFFEDPALLLVDEEVLSERDRKDSHATAHSYIFVGQRKWSRTVIGAPHDRGVGIRWARSVLEVVRDLLTKQTEIDTVMIGNIAAESQDHRYTPAIICAIKQANADTFIYANLGSSQYSLPYDSWSNSLRQVNCFQFSLREAKDFVLAGASSTTSQPTLEEVLHWFCQKKMNVVITLGRGGAVSVFGEFDNDVCLTWSRNLKRDIVDPTGAGDAFGAGFVACISRFRQVGRSPLDLKNDRLLALGTGSVFGALACQGYGGIGGCPASLVAQVGDPTLLNLTQSFPLDEGNDLLYALDRD